MKKRINCTHQHHHHHLKELGRRRRCRRRIKCALEIFIKTYFSLFFFLKPLLSFVWLSLWFWVRRNHVYDFQKSIHRFQIDCLEYKQRYQIFKTCLRPQRPYNAKCNKISYKTIKWVSTKILIWNKVDSRNDISI